jgi:hypothetical protein
MDEVGSAGAGEALGLDISAARLSERDQPRPVTKNLMSRERAAAAAAAATAWCECCAGNIHLVDDDDNHGDGDDIGGSGGSGGSGTAGERMRAARDSQLLAAGAVLPGYTEKDLLELAGRSTRPTGITRAFSFAAAALTPTPTPAPTPTPTPTAAAAPTAAATPTAAAALSREEAAEVLFKAQIGKSSDADAEAELDRVISKSDFAQMEILGQFNLGFIVVRRKNDLFIIDQHATDEKFNFEKLVRTTKMQTQRLVTPPFSPPPPHTHARTRTHTHTHARARAH